METINGLKETPRKAENKVKKKKNQEKIIEKSWRKRKRSTKKRRSFKELVKGTSLKGKLDWEVSK